MADVLNRTTKEYLESVHTPDYPIEDWVHNPDLSTVEGIPPEFWFINPDDTLREMTVEEKDAYYAPNLFACKLEKLQEIHGNTIYLLGAIGFNFNGHNFTLTPEAQTNWDALLTAHNSGLISYPLEVSRSDGTSYQLEDSTALVTFCGIALARVAAVYAQGRPLSTAVWAATTKSEIDAIEDNRA